MSLSTWFDGQKESMYNWFKNGSKYSKFELVLNWFIVMVPAAIMLITSIALAIRWKYFILAMKGEYPPFLWCPIWVGIILAILVCFYIVILILKFQQRRKRLKYHRATVHNKPDKHTGTFVDKIISRDYKTVEDKSGKRKTFN